MLTCKETARLISEGLDRRLSLWQRLNLRLHLMMCGACATYHRQIAMLNRLITQRFRDEEADGPVYGPPCPPEVKQRILARLKEHQP